MVLTICFSQARRIVIEMNHAEFDSSLSSDNIHNIENNLTKLIQQYIEWSSFQNDEGIYSDDKVDQFINLFTPHALIYSDIHINFEEMFPQEYANSVKKHFGDYGLDTTIDYAGLISLTQTNSNQEYEAHLIIQKINYSKIGLENERTFFKNGQTVKFDMFVSINTNSQVYKINRITNEAAKPKAIVFSVKEKSSPNITKSLVRPKTINKPNGWPLQASNTFLRISYGSLLQNRNDSDIADYRIKTPFMVEALLYKNYRNNTFLSVGFQVSKRIIDAEIQNQGSELLSQNPIHYISTSRNNLLEFQQENNTRMVNSEKGIITENLSYSNYSAVLGVNQKFSFSKFSTLIGIDFIPGLQIYQSGIRKATGISGNIIPVNDDFPDIETIMAIDPDVLLNPAYVVSETENLNLLDTDRFQLNVGMHMILNYKLFEKISISTKLGKQINLWTTSGADYDQKYNPIIYSTSQNLKFNPIHFDLGVILKY